MDKQRDFVLRTIEERGVKFVRLWFTDVIGTLKSVAIAPAEVEGAFNEGLGFEHELVVDRGRHEVHAARHAAHHVVGEGADRRAEQTQLELLLDEIASASCSAREEERVVTALDHHL